MASIGKKILSAFVDISDETKPLIPEPIEIRESSMSFQSNDHVPEIKEKFKQYFEKLFTEANLPGPDYFEFSKMIDAMVAISDEKARYSAVFAGLSVQGLNKNKLLSTAADYLHILEKDSTNFSSTVDTALKEKVDTKRKEVEEKTQRIQQLSKELNNLQHDIVRLNDEIKENEEKLEGNLNGYSKALETMKTRIVLDIERIKKHIN